MNDLIGIPPSQLRDMIAEKEAYLQTPGLSNSLTVKTHSELEELKQALQEHEDNSEFFNPENE